MALGMPLLPHTSEDLGFIHHLADSPRGDPFPPQEAQKGDCGCSRGVKAHTLAPIISRPAGPALPGEVGMQEKERSAPGLVDHLKKRGGCGGPRTYPKRFEQIPT